MKVVMSNYLVKSKQTVKKLVALLREKYDYVSVLGTDVSGKRLIVKDTSMSITDTNWVERGFVARILSDGRYYEYSFNELNEENLATIAWKISAGLEESKKINQDIISYPEILEEELTKSYLGETYISPYDMSSKEKFQKLKEINSKAHTCSEYLIDCTVVCSTNHVSKIFISDKKDLEQSYIWSEAYLMPLVRKGNVTRNYFKSYSGLKGMEILSELESEIEISVEKANKLLDAKTITPGEYDVICAPGAVGVIVHEAFGHGVEMDMFVKNRAKGADYIGKQVASDMVTMHDGAAAAKHVSSYLFDDEGTLGTDTTVIKNGILQTGMSDVLSACKLGTTPTGNGKRESYMSKAYSRMTNTFFEPGKDKLEDMIASVSHGYYIEDVLGGMEDPKDWGIQVMFISAVEIKDGKLTDNVFAPIIMTGYVPDLLCSISMVSDDFKLEGAGACGKGYKEWVKVSDGGPYIKVKARLG